jgi:hypothetical protein
MSQILDLYKLALVEIQNVLKCNIGINVNTALLMGSMTVFNILQN